MFGIFRLVLAVMVLITHIGGVEMVAGFAVWGFFMLSGFLMTAVLNSKYGFTGRGLILFAISRMIRLFPTYWVSCVITVVIIMVFANTFDPRLINNALQFPITIRELFANLFIVGHTTFGIGRVERALSPSTWAVDVEILMYICSCLFLARSKRVALSLLLGSMLVFPIFWFLAKIAISKGQIELGNELIYSFLPIALLPYAIGSYLWFIREQLSPHFYSQRSVYFSIIWLVISAFILSRVSVTIAYLLSLPGLAVIIIFLSAQKKTGMFRLVDELCGRMSYPFYLLQWICAYIVLVIVPPNYIWFEIVDSRAQFTPAGFFAVLIVLLFLSLLMALVVEGPVERFRHGVVRWFVKLS